MYDRKVTLSLTEAEWRALCETAKSADRTPKLQARHLVRAALGLTNKEAWEQIIGEDSLLEALAEATEAADRFMRQLEASYGELEMPDYYVSAMAKARKVIAQKKQQLRG